MDYYGEQLNVWYFKGKFYIDRPGLKDFKPRHRRENDKDCLQRNKALK